MWGFSMNMNTNNFGEINIDENKIIVFSDGILGFESLKRFTIIKTDDSIPLYWLQAIDEDISLPCIDPLNFFAEYTPVISEEDMIHLGVSDESDLVVLNTVVIREQPFCATTNLAAPIVINTVNNQGAQIVIQNSDYNVREPLVQMKEGSDNADIDKVDR